MKRRTLLGGVIGVGLAGKNSPIPTTTYGKTGVKVTIIAQGGARMDLHPDIKSAAEYVRQVYNRGVTFFDCARMYWDGRAEEAYGIGLAGVRKNIFLTSKSTKRTRKEAEADLETSLRLLKTGYLDIWQIHAIQSQEEIDRILGPGGAMEAFEAAKKAGKTRFIGFTGHFHPEVHAAFLKAYPNWDSVVMPVHAAEQTYLSFEKTALPIAKEMGIGVQAIKVFGKAFLLRSLSPTECLQYALSQNIHVAICGAGTIGQMEDNIRTVQSFKRLTDEQIADVRRRAIIGQGVYTGPTLEYWKKANT